MIQLFAANRASPLERLRKIEVLSVSERYKSRVLLFETCNGSGTDICIDVESCHWVFSTIERSTITERGEGGGEKVNGRKNRYETALFCFPKMRKPSADPSAVSLKEPTVGQ